MRLVANDLSAGCRDFCIVKVNEIQEVQHGDRDIAKASGVGGKWFLISKM